MRNRGDCRIDGRSFPGRAGGRRHRACRSPEWLTIERPGSRLSKLICRNCREEARYTIQRHIRGGGRKDIITFGEPGRSLRYVMLEIYRPGTELADFADPVSEIAARADTLAPADAVRVSFPMETKFGKIATVDFAAGRFGGQCVGFVRNFNAPRLQIAGSPATWTRSSTAPR